MKNNMQKKLIIVASGKTVLDNKMGNEIDAFDKVLRFNGYQYGLNIYDEYVGTKTDLLFCNSSKVSAAILEKFPNIYPEDTRFIIKRKKKKQKTLGEILISNNYILNNIIYYRKIYRNIAKNNIVVSIPPRIKNPTLGLMSIFYALNEYQDYKIYIHGFDRIVKKITRRRYMDHYYSSKPNINYKHAVSIETSTIKKLLNHDFITRFIPE